MAEPDDEGTVPAENPIGVTGREMLDAVHRAPGGTGYRELRRFFGKLHALSFEVERTQGSKHKMGRFHLFHAMFHEGEKREDGTITEMNEIEVAPWYLKSLQAGNCLVIDHALFQQLSLSLSKLLHQFLHAQFHFHQGVATEWYTDIAKNWQIKEYSALRRIKQQLDPSHEELKRVGFLESWDYLPFKRAGKKVYQIRWHAGPQWVAIAEVQKTENLRSLLDRILSCESSPLMAGPWRLESEGALYPVTAWVHGRSAISLPILTGVD